jgi:hypothetical protein
MWAIRLIVGPWFNNLPHGGGIGQAIIESAADALLFVAVSRRVQSPWLALAGVLAIATSAYDMALSAIVWTTVIASAFGKIAIALILLRWHERSLWRMAIVAALAWSAVHVYSGAVLLATLFAVSPSSPRLRTSIGVVLFAGVAALVPARLQMAATLHKLPEYRVLVDASRQIVATRQTVRAVIADFPLPPSTESDFLYRVLGANRSWRVTDSGDSP